MFVAVRVAFPLCSFLLVGVCFLLLQSCQFIPDNAQILINKIPIPCPLGNLYGKTIENSTCQSKQSSYG